MAQDIRLYAYIIYHIFKMKHIILNNIPFCQNTCIHRDVVYCIYKYVYLYQQLYTCKLARCILTPNVWRLHVPLIYLSTPHLPRFETPAPGHVSERSERSMWTRPRASGGWLSGRLNRRQLHMCVCIWGIVIYIHFSKHCNLSTLPTLLKRFSIPWAKYLL